MNIQLVRKAFKIGLLLTINAFYSALTASAPSQTIDNKLENKTAHAPLNTNKGPAEMPRALITVSPVSSEVPAAAEGSGIIQNPLQYEKQSISAFESEQFEIPQPDYSIAPETPQAVKTGKENGARPKFGGEPISPMLAPLTFISPSIRAYPFISNLAHVHRKTPLNFEFTGYIKNEAFADSAQIFGSDQDEYLLYPLKPAPDCAGNDTNSKGQFNMLAIESRIRTDIAGPMIFGAKSYGVIEGDFWAQSLNFLQMSLLRIRHAFLYFEWKDKSLLLGQYWHPLILPECFADTISFNGGSPFEPFSREPQMRLTKQFDNMTFIASIGAHVNSPYDGPLGINSIYARNGVLPNTNIQLLASVRKHIFGVGVDMTRLVPRLITNKNFRANESLMSYILMAFASFNWENLGLRLKFIYGQNGNPMTLISGYAVHSIDPYTDHRSYTNTQCLNLWLDTAYKGEIEPGLFMGISKNIGAVKSIIPSITNNGQTEKLIYTGGQDNVGMVYRFQPRIRWFLKPFIFGSELEVTGATFGTLTDTGRVINTKLVNNVRVLLAAFYVF